MLPPKPRCPLSDRSGSNRSAFGKRGQVGDSQRPEAALPLAVGWRQLRRRCGWYGCGIGPVERHGSSCTSGTCARESWVGLRKLDRGGPDGPDRRARVGLLIDGCQRSPPGRARWCEDTIESMLVPLQRPEDGEKTQIKSSSWAPMLYFKITVRRRLDSGSKSFE